MRPLFSHHQRKVSFWHSTADPRYQCMGRRSEANRTHRRRRIIDANFRNLTWADRGPRPRSARDWIDARGGRGSMTSGDKIVEVLKRTNVVICTAVPTDYAIRT